jgi:hypothetical protein
MPTLFNDTDSQAIISRIQKLDPSSPRQWGKMNVAQMLAHCNVSLETAMGKNSMKRLLIGRILGPLVRKQVLGPKPFGKNSPTDKSYVFKDERNFEEEKAKILETIRNFHENGAAGCTKDAHPFFGHFTPEEWALFQWKHLDHHLRQFGV